MTTRTGERATLIKALARHRGFLLQTAEGLTEEQARTASTVSALTIASLLKHVADTEEQWLQFARPGSGAFADSGVYESNIDWAAVEAEAASNDGEWSGSEWGDTRFSVSDAETLPVLLARMAEVAACTQEFLETVDLDLAQMLPGAPWFEPGAACRCAGWCCTCSQRSPSMRAMQTSSGR